MESNENNEIKKRDFRADRQLVIFDKKEEKFHYLTKLEIYKVNSKIIEFPTPNIVTMFLSITAKNYLEAKKLFEENIRHNLKKNSPIKFEEKDLTNLYNYFSTLKISIIFSYNAIEAFINMSIPEDYKYEFKNNKGIKEVWDKEAIQRWMSTSDKLLKILPSLKNVDKPTNEPFWNNFKNLENLRNDIIHPKQISIEKHVTYQIHKIFFDLNVFNWINSSQKVLNYFCQGEYAEQYYPISFGAEKVKPIEYDDINDFYTTIENYNESDI